MINYASLKQSELIELLASNTDKYLASFKIKLDSQNQMQSKEIIDEIVIELTRRRFEYPIDYCHNQQDNHSN